MPDLSSLGEEAVVARLTALLEAGPGVLTGPGDDCAVVEGPGRGIVELLKTDCLVCGVHFLPEAAAGKVGWKAVARTLSDFAAMGGWPRHLLVTLAVPASCEMRWVEQLYRGMNKCARAYDCSIVGGGDFLSPCRGPGHDLGCGYGNGHAFAGCAAERGPPRGPALCDREAGRVAARPPSDIYASPG